MLSVDQFLRLISLPAVVAAFFRRGISAPATSENGQRVGQITGKLAQDTAKFDAVRRIGALACCLNGFYGPEKYFGTKQAR
jgi:hypothetical protein